MAAGALDLITSFHYAVSVETGNDVSIARAKTMVALATLTWPGLGIDVTPHFINPRRVAWRSEEFDAMSAGASFRRDPIGDDAPIVMENVDPSSLIMRDEMGQCAAFIPLFGRQRLEHFNVTLAGCFTRKRHNDPLPLPGTEPREMFPHEEEYRRLFGWLVDHRTITPQGEWKNG